MKNLHLTLLSFLLCSIPSSLGAGSLNFTCNTFSSDSNSPVEGDDIRLEIAENFSCMGPVYGKKTATINCKNITGKGSIKAPEIRIKAENFNFTGTIECNKTCSIITKNPIKAKFKKAGKGKFSVSVDPNLTMTRAESDLAYRPSFPEPIRPIPFENRFEKREPIISHALKPRPVENEVALWWRDIQKMNLQPRIKVYRLVIQFDVPQDRMGSDEWIAIQNTALKIADVFKGNGGNFFDLVLSLPYDKYEQKSIEGLSCKTSVRIVKAEDISPMLDSDISDCKLMVGIFMCYDPERTKFDEILSEKSVPAVTALLSLHECLERGETAKLQEYYACRPFMSITTAR